MTDGYRLKVPGVATGTGFKKLSLDPVLPQQGALLLLDPTHPADPIAAGVPAADSFLPNIAWEQAKAMIGSGDRLSLGMQRKSSGTLTGGVGKLERSSKGGIHGIASQTAMVAGAYEHLVLSDLLKTYIALAAGGHTTDDLFLSAWIVATRPPQYVATNVNRYFAIAKDSSPTNTYKAMFHVRDSDSSGAVNEGASTYPGSSNGAAAWIGSVVDRQAGAQTSGLGWRRFALGVNDWVIPGGGSLPANLADVIARFGWGRDAAGVKGDSSSDYAVPANAAPSFIVQRLYIEDLTVSGRTYAAVNALDQAEHVKHVQTVGGRYYGDTFVTDPATIP